MHRLVLPGIFWRDHDDRCADHEGERTVIRDNGGLRVIVELDDKALADLRSDADYYGNPGAAWDEDYLRRIGRSARATLRAIARQLGGAQ